MPSLTFHDIMIWVYTSFSSKPKLEMNPLVSIPDAKENQHLDVWLINELHMPCSIAMLNIVKLPEGNILEVLLLRGVCGKWEKTLGSLEKA